MTSESKITKHLEESEIASEVGTTSDYDRLMPRIYFVATVFALYTIVDSILRYREFSAWQILADAGGILLGLIILRISHWYFKRNKREVAESLIPLVVLFAYAPGDLFLSGVTFYNLISGLLLLLLFWLLIKPQNRRIWVLSAIIFSAAVLIFSQINSIPRFNIERSESWLNSLPIFTGAITAAILIQFVLSIQYRSIRLRLLISFILLAIIPTLMSIIISSILDYQNSRDQAIEYIESVATAKELQIQSWIRDLEVSLSSVIRQEEPVRELLSTIIIEPSNPVVLKDLKFAVQETGSFDKLYLINNRGLVEQSTDSNLVGLSYGSKDFFQGGQKDFYVSPLTDNPDRAKNIVVVVWPLKDNSGITEGLLVGEVNINRMDEILLDYSKLGETGESYLIGNSLQLLTETRNATDLQPGVSRIQSTWLGSAIESKQIEYGLYSNYQDEEVISSFHWLPDLYVGLIVEQYQSEAFQPFRTKLAITVGFSIIPILGAIFISIIISRNISQPIMALANSATMLTSGDIDKFEPVIRDDEIGDLSNALSEMTARLQSSLSQREETIEQRTKILERKTLHLEAIAEIGRAATEIYNLEELLRTITHLISEKFNFYHVGIFILDERGEFAVLKAANSEGGWQMLARGHKLKVGEQGIVGYVTGSRKPRIQQSVVGEDSVHYDNPDLPLTKSEMALPLTAGSEIIGALDIQSTLEHAFSEEDVSVLQSLADEVAITINNTRLFEQLQESLETERRIYGDFSSEAWSTIQNQSKHILNIRSDESGVYQVSDNPPPESQQAVQSQRTILADPSSGNQRYPISIPVKVRGNVVVAILETYKPTTSGQWTSQEITILEAISEQLGIALENARLFDETQRLAQRERIAAEVAGKIWASTNVETILQTAVQELGRALNVSQGAIRLRIPEDSGSDEISPDNLGVEKA